MLLVHAAATWFLVGLIWTVQLVHYPLFARVGDREFAAYHAGHTRRITWLVGVVMPVELVTGVHLSLTSAASGVDPTLAWCGVALLFVIWGVTGLVQVRQHASLARHADVGVDERVVRALVAGNWIRTAAWTIRGVIVTWMMSGVSPAP